MESTPIPPPYQNEKANHRIAIVAIPGLTDKNWRVFSLRLVLTRGWQMVKLLRPVRELRQNLAEAMNLIEIVWSANIN
jgi:hypothetical protein